MVLGSGICSSLLSLILLSKTDLGVACFPLSSMLTGVLRNMIFTPIYAARCLEIRWNRFYSDIFLGFASIGTITVLGLLSRMIVPIHSWIILLLTGVVMGPLVNCFVILRKQERNMVIGMVRSRLKGEA